jgi:hypothetical protein
MCNREANGCANLLENLGHTSLELNCNFFFYILPYALKLLLKDGVRGVSLSRFI